MEDAFSRPIPARYNTAGEFIHPGRVPGDLRLRSFADLPLPGAKSPDAARADNRQVLFFLFRQACARSVADLPQFTGVVSVQPLLEARSSGSGRSFVGEFPLVAGGHSKAQVRNQANQPGEENKPLRLARQ